MKKKTFFVLSLAIMLLGLSGSQAQQTGEFIIPASTYTLTSQAGTFTDIADHPATVKLGTGLAGNTALLNGFFVNAETANFVTHTADSSKRDPGFPLDFEFNLCGKKMTHFTICASGGLHFGQSANIPQAQSAAWFTKTANYQNLVTLSVTAGGQTNAMTSISGKAPAMYLIEGETGAKVLTVQYDYSVNGDEWIYQLKAYEADGRIEMVVKDLATANAGEKTPYRLFLGLVENGNSNIPDEPFGTLNLNFCREYNVPRGSHQIGFKQFSAADWSTFSAHVATGTEQGMYLSGTQKPAEGHTLAFRPYTCPATPGLAADRYAFTLSSISKTNMTGQVAYTSAVTPAELSASGTVMAVLSTSETPDYTLTDGTWYRQGDKIGSATVLANAKPTYTIAIKIATGDTIISGDRYLKLSADNLTAGTTYYIHVYSMSYQCLGAPTYSGLCQTFRFTSSIDLPQKLSAGLPTTSSVPVTVQSAGEGFGVVLLKSPNTNPVSLSGKLNPGDKFGDVEVLTVINSTSETKFDAPFEAGEGAYILAVSATGLDQERPTYAPDFLSVPVRAAYDGLPTLEFSQETASYPQQNAYPSLPFGWQREIELPVAQRSNAFGLRGDEGDPICLYSSYANGITDWVDVVTPVFVTNKRAIQATFLVSYLKNAQQGDPLEYSAGQTDEIRVEYAIGDGAWQVATQLKGNDYEFPAANAQGRYAISVNLRKIAIGSAIRLRYSYKSPSPEATIHHRIHRVEIIEGRECLPPTAVVFTDSLTTDQSLTLQWIDNNYPQAANFVIAYRPAAETGNAWQYRRVATPANHPAETPLKAAIQDLNAATLYTAQVAAICGTRDTSFYSQTVTVRTAYALPYEESMAQTGAGATTQTPFDRGVKTYRGIIGGTLTETEDGWSQAITSNEYNRATTVSIGDFTSNAWLMTPAIFITETGAFTPKSLRFTLNSFDADKNKGILPNYDDTKLYVLASKNGVFTRNDIILTLEADDLALTDSVFSLDLSEREGRLQIAFVFECPSAVRTGEGDESQTEEAEPWYLEISQLRLAYDVDVCFPVSKLRRSLGVNELACSWEASASAVEYGILWGLDDEEGYTDTAYTKETNYTITGLEEQTRYKIMVVAYCSEDRSLYSEPATTTAPTLLGCHTPTDFAVSHITLTGADFSSQTDQPDYTTLRLVYVWTESDSNMRVFRQMNDTLSLQDSLTARTAYRAATRAVCGTDTSAMSAELRFVTEPTATEAVAQINALFNVRTQDGRIFIRNLNGLLIQRVSVYSLNGVKLADCRPDSRDDLDLSVQARHALLFVRLQTEKGTAVYKVYLQ